MMKLSWNIDSERCFDLIPEMNRSGSQSVGTIAQEESNRKGGAWMRSDRCSGKAPNPKDSSGQQRSQRGRSSAISANAPDAQPSSTFESRNVDTTPASSHANGNKASSHGFHETMKDEIFLASYDSNILDATAQGSWVESSAESMTPKDAYNYLPKNVLHNRPPTYGDFDNDQNGGTALESGNDLVASSFVDEEELEVQYQAKLVKSEISTEMESEDKLLNRGRCWKMIGCFLVMICLVLAIVIPLSKEKKENLTYPPTAAPTKQSTYDYLFKLFYPYSGDALRDNTTVQYRALQWIALEDPLHLPFKETNQSTLIERYSAAVLYYSTGGELWSNRLGFLSNASICAWSRDGYGIFCDETQQHVYRIDIDGNNLNGTIPAELLGFSKLNLLTLGSGLRGTLPSELGDMTALTFLQFFGHDITGTIPSTYSQLNLQALNLHNNLLSGSIPSSMFHDKSNLEYIILSQNQFTGPLPDIKGQSASTYMYLDNNLFEGTIPPVYFEQDALMLLELSNNLLTGTIPEQIQALSRLTFFYGSQNFFSGTIPSGLGTLRDLQEYLMAENRLTGSIPSSLGQFDMLTTLSLGGNFLTGSLPSELANVVTLITFNVSSNQLSGTVPSTFLQLTSMTEFDISSTNIVGGLEETFCALDILSTSIAADCLGNSSSTITCSCCSTCCNDDDDMCQVHLPSLCEAKSTEFALAPDRGTTCDCLNGGAIMSCTDTACQSCNIEGTVCAQSTEYGYSFDPVTGEILSFHNVIQYTTGRNETLVYTKTAKDDSCILEVNGENCRACTSLVCEDSSQGFQIDCSNLLGGAKIVTCDSSSSSDKTLGYLQVFYLTEYSALSGCPPVLMDLQPESNDR